MKKITLSLLSSILLWGITNSQTYTFQYSQFNSAYTPLVGGTDVYGVTPWNSGSIVPLPIGFNFNYQGYVQTTADLIPGAIAFNPTVDNMGFYSFFAFLTDTGSIVSKSPVTYLTSGTSGNRIFKVQISDAGFEGEYNVDSAYSSVINFQTWMYESDNSFEVHVGYSTISNPLNCYLDSTSPGPVVGVIQLDSAQTNLLYSLALTGNPAAPTQTVYNISNFPPVSLNSTPANGTVYRFGQVVSGINESAKVFSLVGLFPNPSNENSVLLYSLKNAGDVMVMISDIDGRTISTIDLGMQAQGSYHHDLNTSAMSNGIYFVTLISGEQKITQKLSVAH